MSDLARRIAALSPEKRELLLQQLKQQRESTSQEKILSRGKTANVFPLSFAQQRLWFLDQWEPGSFLYNMYQALHLEGPLQVTFLERCLNEIVRRHDSLRTTFVLRADHPAQVVHPTLYIPITTLNLSDLPLEEREQQARAWMMQEIRRPFDLAQGPLLRAYLLRLGPQEHILLLTLHHSIADGWSITIFFQELTALYEAYATGHPSSLPALPIQYADYTLWQREWLQGETLEQHLSYWKQQLAGAPEILELPTDHPHPPVPTHQGARYPFTLSHELTERLTVLSRLEETTLFMTMLAAFQVFLFRYTGQADFMIGTPIANRGRTEIESLIGFFVNTLVIRSNLSGESSFHNVLAHVRETTLDAYAHQELPFEQLVESLRPERSLSHTPLFQIVFALQNAPQPVRELAGLRLRTLLLERQTAKVDLSLTLQETDASLQGWWEYSTDLFEAETIARWHTHFLTLLHGLLAHPSLPISSLPLLSPSEIFQLVFAANATHTSFHDAPSVPALFFSQVAQTPDAIALLDGTSHLSYQHLAARVSSLAARLRLLGVGPEVRVGLCLPRGFDLLIALLAVLSAGGAAVPLDPTYPTQRLAFLLQDAHITLLLTHQRLRSHLPAELPALLALDLPDPDPTPQPFSLLEPHPLQLAYVIYTSGSTGTPKGVLIPHRALRNFLLAAHADLRVQPQDRILQLASLSFDASLLEIFLALSTGACLTLAPAEVLGTGAPLAHLLEHHAITLLALPPSLLDPLPPLSLPALHTIIVGGEACSAALAARWAPGRRFFNAYAPTETTIYAALWPCAQPFSQPPPIGHPIANMQLYLLDAHLQPVPLGVIGQLYLGGIGLARGYHQRPELTAEQFLPDPFSREPGARLYGSGDLARWRADGSLQFLGRADQQVKLHGVRIELGEIEAVLRSHPAVQDAVVLLREARPGDLRLVAYVLEQGEETVTLREVRAHLHQHLPDYMLPSALLSVAVWPLTPQGKLDRAALPSPQWSQQQRPVVQGPRTPLEEVLMRIWCEVLGIEEIGIEEDFFELGGHSLLAAQIMTRIRETFQVELPLRTLFEKPTVTDLAEQIEKLQHGPSSPTPSLQALPRDGTPLSFAQERLWFLDQWQPNDSLYNITTALSLLGRINIATLERSLHEIIRRHEVLRSSFPTVEGHPVQIITPHLPVPLTLIDLTGLPEKEQQHALQQQAVQEARLPFALARGPLLRTHLLRLSQEKHVLLLSLHHIIFDGQSMNVLMHELATLYDAFSAGKPSPLSPLTIQYADYALWQRQRLQGEVLERHLAYWRQQLAGTSFVLELPTDRPRPAVRTFRGAHYHFAISEPIATALKALSQREKVTLFMTLFAAFQTLLFRYSGQMDFLIGTPIANRNRTEIEHMIGFFTNTLVLRCDLRGDPSFRTLLKRVREVTLGAYTHQDLPFEQLVSLLQPERNLSHTPLFQALFALQQAPSDLKKAGLSLLPLEIESGRVKFDLTLSLQDTGYSLQAAFGYNTDLFDRPTIIRMAGHFCTLLEGIVTSSECHIADLPLLTAPELAYLLDGEYTRIEPSPQRPCIHTLFETQAARTPDAVAVVFEHEQLTYHELNRHAERVAHHLQRLGAGPQMLIGLCVERSPELLIGMLAILKAGAAYVPLDPTIPAERFSFILQDARISILLTQARLQEKLPAHDVHVLCLDGDQIADGSKNEIVAHPSRVQPENAAYVIYTSGSTGQPKGVLINHAHVTRLFATTDNWFRFNSDDVWTLFHSFAFDFSVWEIWGALLYGGRLVIIPHQISRSPEAFYESLCMQQVTVLNQTPSAFRLLVQADEDFATPQDLALRLIIFGGEALELQSLRPWFKRHGDQIPQLVNMYGITETTVHVTYRPLSADDTALTARSVIGRPLPDLQIYVLDQHMQPVPIGVPGELYIGGMGLSQGYLHRPALTAERFLPHPFVGTSHDESGSYSVSEGSRLYKTGDLARYLANGDIEYLGRNDEQVKIRGFRIEPGEIEAVLSGHPAVRESVIIAREDRPGEQRLIAYVVVHQHYTFSHAELRSYLLQHLPDYMLPSAIMQLEALPLTPNGKLDRQTLPTPYSVRPEQDTPYVAPRTPVEEILTGIWCRVLGLTHVGMLDNFFALGGDSIRSVQVLAQAKQRGIFFSLQQFFQAQTISQLAQTLQAEQSEPMPHLPNLPFALVTAEDRSRLPEGIEDAYPLTMLQRGMLFHSEYSTDAAIYHNITSFHLRAPFDQQQLQVAIQQLIAEHPVLRTSFDLSNFSEPLQLLQRSVLLPLRITDLRQYTLSEQEEMLERWLEDEKQHKFDWTQAPLVRFQVHRRSEETFQFTLTEHHAILDGWSVAALLTELFQRYLVLLESTTTPLRPPLTASFRDAVALEQEALASQEMRRYWHDKLADSTVMTLPRETDAIDQKPEMHVLHVSISQDISERLKQLARSTAVPLKSVLLAAHLNVMRLLGGQADVLTGLVSNGRPETIDGERVAGLFLNTLPYRQQLGGGRWTELIQETFANEWEMLPFRRYPLAQIQLEQGGKALFETVFNFIHFHVYQGLQGLKKLQILERKGFAQTNFTLVAHFSLSLATAQVQLNLECNASLLGKEQIAAIGDYYVQTLAAMANSPNERYELHSLLSAQENEQLLLTWNATTATYPQEGRIHRCFEAQAQRTPDAIALVFADNNLTYDELNCRANQLAHHLHTLGVCIETPVGLYLERSLDMVIALLAVLKAGGAYLPLEPDSPHQRLAYMLHDAVIQVLLTQQHLASQLPSYSGMLVRIDSDWQRIAQYATTNPISDTQPDNLAYIIYTSGSTGKPKGVMNTHRGIFNRLYWMQETYCLQASDRILQKTPYSFDVSVWEFFWPLMIGATLVVMPPEQHRDASALVATVITQQITTLHFVPSMLRLFLEERELEHCQSLKRVICSGEALSQEIQDRFFAWLNCELHNLYGPTEAAIDVTYWACMREDGRHFVPIGRPIANSQIYILDAHLQSVPVGIAGELYIGGAGLARGYFQQAALTAERFIPHPFVGTSHDESGSDSASLSEPGARLYRTGDMACYHRDGTIQFLGRADHQVKLRGFRIELAEIETTLMMHPALREAVVMVREDIPHDKRLIAYIVPAQEVAPTHSELRFFLRERLPDYMLPAAFITLDVLPLTPNGKLNRRALPAPDGTRADLSEAYVAPRTPTEEVLVNIWTNVLGMEHISIHDTFFELGGHSLLATQVIARIRTIFQIELPLRSLFESPTVAKLAQQVERERQAVHGLPVPPLSSRPHDGTLPVSFAQQRLWLLEQMNLRHSLYTIPAITRLLGPLSLTILERSLNDIIQRHEALRTTFTIVDGYPAQVINPTSHLPILVISLETLTSTDQEAESQRQVTETIQHPFNLSTGPLLRVHLLRLSAEEHILLLALHHSIADGWSMAVLFQELTALYEAYATGHPSPLPALPIQYADYTLWQREWLQGETLEQHLSYWKQQLAGAPEILELPTDRPRPPVQTHQGARYPFTLPHELTAQLKALSKREGVTLFMTLLAAFQVFLFRYTGQTDLVVGTPIANRTWSELESLIGCFINTLALRGDLSGEPTFHEVLMRVRETTLDAYAHQDLPFEQLVEVLRPGRSLSHTPLFQIMFVLQNTPQPIRTLADLTLLPVEVANDISRFELTLAMVDSEQGLQGIWEYSTDLFEAETIVRWHTHFLTLLHGLLAHPLQSISSLSLLSPSERSQLVLAAHATATPFHDTPSVPALFFSQVAQTPDAIVLLDGTSHLSYQHLAARVSSLAARLHLLGVGPEVRVGLCLPRGFDLLIALLAVLSAGGAAVPLDPTYPTQRLAFLLEDAHICLLLTHQSLRSHLPAELPALLALDLPDPDPAPAPLPLAEPHSLQLAYVIYTSGSTGTPKGVLIPHRALRNFLLAAHADLGVLPHDRILQLASLSFDASLLEIFLALSTGACLTLAPAEVLGTGAPLAHLLEQHAITLLALPPSLLDPLPALPLPALHTIIVGGEACSAALAARWAPARRFFNAYAPTETTIYAALWPCAEPFSQPPPIGHPIANMQLYLLDAHLQPVPLGVVGQLFLGGVGLARGYHQRPELTAQQFLPDPFSREPGARLYASGDLARWRADGSLQFLGRTDQQVKLHGLRIELGEIEAALRSHPAVSETVVLLREARPGDLRLVAYVLEQGEETLTLREVRAHLQQRLPDYMLPSALLSVSAWPLTPQGKLDRAALPSPQWSQQQRPVIQGPRTPLEEVLERIWCEVLGIEQIGIEEDFFELGGHSLLAAQVMTRIRETFQIELPLLVIFGMPCIAELANVIMQSQQTQETTKIQTVPRESQDVDQLVAELDQLPEHIVEQLLAAEMRRTDKEDR